MATSTPVDDLERHRRGDFTEAIVIAELVNRGIGVATPFGDNERYDIVIESGDGDVYRAQIKTGRLVNGTVQFDGHSRHTNTQGSTYDPYGDDVDCFLVYYHEGERLFLVPAEEVTSRFSIRIAPPDRDQSTINHDRDYDFDRQWHELDSTHRDAVDTDLPPHRRGDATEAIVIAELMGRGIPIARPPTDNERYDLLLGTPPGDFVTCQVKTGRITDGVVTCQARTNHVNSSGSVSKYYDGDVDYFLIFVPQNGELYLISEDSFNTSITLRLDDGERVSRRTRLAADVTFDEVWPPNDDSDYRDIGRNSKTVREAVLDRIAELDIDAFLPANEERPTELRLFTGDGIGIEAVMRLASRQDGYVYYQAKTRVDDRIDHYLLYCPGTGEVYIVPVELVDPSLSLRLSEPSVVRRVTLWAEDFELEAAWPPDPTGPLPRRSLIGTAVTAFEAVDARIAIPRGDEPFDLLVAPPGGDFLRVAIEPGWVSSCRVRLKPDRRDGVDAYLVHCRSLDEQYLVYQDEFDVSISLRVDPPKQHASMTHPADEYVLRARWPTVA